MRVLVCGGRDYADSAEVDGVLSSLHAESVDGISFVIHGDAPGADALAGCWAEENDVPVLRFPADWAAHGRAAGPLRNAQMLAEGRPSLVVAFPGGRGTADMVRRARAAGVHVVDVRAAKEGGR